MLKSRCGTEERFHMKRLIVWSGFLLLLIVVSVVALRAVGPSQRGWDGHGWRGNRWSHHGPLGYVAHELKLNDAQRSQIKSMWQAERPTVASLVQELASENKEMDSVTSQGSFDDAKVQVIASRQGETIAKLLVEKERLESKVYNDVLNPEQRAKADELQKTWHSRLDRIAAKVGGDARSFD
jgi:Spy/CpxP family protein refolding chaperone